jgi:hypothetical protein
MLEEYHPIVLSQAGLKSHVRTFGNPVHQFRFLPESYLAAVGTQWDPGLDLLVYLQMFIEDESDDVVQ